MDVRHLHLLRELANRGSITAVAAATHRTVSAVSQQLRTAQRDAGVPLVEAEGRGVRLTAAGRLLAEGAVEVDAVVAAIQARWDEYRNTPVGNVSLVAFPSAATLLLPDVLRQAQDAGVSVTATDLDLAESEFATYTKDHDIVIAHSLEGTPRNTGSLTVVPLLAEPLDVAISPRHRLAQTCTPSLEDLGAADWIGVPEGYPFDTVTNAIGQKLGKPLRVVQRMRDNRVIEALVSSGKYLAVLPRFTTRVSADLMLIPLTHVPAQRYITALVQPDKAKRKAVQVVLTALQETARATALT